MHFFFICEKYIIHVYGIVGVVENLLVTENCIMFNKKRSTINNVNNEPFS